MQEFLINWIINPEELLTGSSPSLPWILATGDWNDAAFWIDTEVWID